METNETPLDPPLNFIEELGGVQARSKRTFGVCAPPVLEISDAMMILKM